MPDTSTTESATENGKSASKSDRKKRRRGAGGWRFRMPTGAGSNSRWPAFTALVIALIAVGLAVVAWLYPLHGGTSKSFNAQQTDDAKKNVCTAYTAVKQGVVTNTHQSAGDNPIGQLAVASNARLSLLGGGLYLRDRLSAQPAAPDDIAKAVKSMADTIEELGINYLAGVSYLVQDPLRDDLNAEIAQLDSMCG